MSGERATARGGGRSTESSQISAPGSGAAAISVPDPSTSITRASARAGASFERPVAAAADMWKLFE